MDEVVAWVSSIEVGRWHESLPEQQFAIRLAGKSDGVGAREKSHDIEIFSLSSFIHHLHWISPQLFQSDQIIALFSSVGFVLISVHYHYVFRRVALKKADNSQLTPVIHHRNNINTLPICQNACAQISSAFGEFGRFHHAVAYLHTQR